MNLASGYARNGERRSRKTGSTNNRNKKMKIPQIPEKVIPIISFKITNNKAIDKKEVTNEQRNNISSLG